MVFAELGKNSIGIISYHFWVLKHLGCEWIIDISDDCKHLKWDYEYWTDWIKSVLSAKLKF